MAEYSVLCAVATGKADLVAAAVAKGCTVNETDQEGNSCLHIAAAKGSNAILRILLNADAKVSAKNKAGYTSVELAVEQKNEATVEVLLEAIVAAGMDIDARYESWREQGQTLLMRASALGLTSTAAKLLALGADIAAKDANGKGVFDHTKEIKDEEKREAVLALMAEYSVLCAVATGKADLVAAAVAKGCSMNETDQEGNSCLHIAAAQGSNEILRILLNAGAKVSAKNKAGNTAVELAQNAQTIDDLKGAGATMPEFPEEKKNDLLIEYAKKGATGGALMALQAGADVNHKDWRFRLKVYVSAEHEEQNSATALHSAAMGGHEAMAQGLLGAGADINAADSLSRTALHFAAMGLGAGADINATDYYGRTPLHWAAEHNKPEVAKVLLANGAQVNVRTKNGQTALAFARGKPEMEALLRQHGAV
jgi:ankyrin repeat protein